MNLEKIVEKQSSQIESLLADADAIRQKWRGVDMAGDRVDYIFTGDIIFLEKVNTSQNIIFQIPEATDFYGTRLMLQPFARFVTQDQPNQGPNEIPFRPVVWSTTEGVYNNNSNSPADLYGGVQNDVASLDCSVTMTENIKTPEGQITRDYQNMPSPVQLFYSGGVNYGSGISAWQHTNVTYFPDFQIPIGMLFPIDYYLPKGSSVTLKITPTFSEERVAPGLVDDGGAPFTGNRQTEYQIRAFLQGYKIVGDS